jgi:hypothetical protein
MQVARLRGLVRRWHVASERPGTDAGMAVLDIAMEVREILGMEPGR